MANKDASLTQFHSRYIAAIRALQGQMPHLDTYAHLAEHIGMSRDSLRMIMQGAQAPTVTQGILLCNTVGINANWLFGLEPNMYRSAMQTTPWQQLKAAVAALEAERVAAVNTSRKTPRRELKSKSARTVES